MPKIGYKGTTNFKCKNLTYEVGKTYVFHGQLKLCNSGFHFCDNIMNINISYPLSDKNTKILQIEIPDDAVVINGDNKSVTNKLRVIKVLTPKEIEEISKGKIKYDKNGNAIYLEDSRGYWWKKKYDKNGNVIYYEDSSGYWEKSEYDENGNVIRYEDSTEYCYEQRYDKKGNAVYLEDSRGYWWKKKYDKSRNVIHYEDSRGYWWKKKYDKNGNVIYYEDSTGKKWSIDIV